MREALGGWGLGGTCEVGANLGPDGTGSERDEKQLERHDRKWQMF